MTLEDLDDIYQSAALDRCSRLGLKAVVEALRDEIRNTWNDDITLEQIFDEILGSDGGVKAAGGPTSNDGPGGVEQAEPALTPAADVCEWEKLRRPSWGFKVSCSDKRLMNENFGGDICPLCDKRIEYKEPTP